MKRKSKHIPVNTLLPGIREGIFIGRTVFDGPPDTEDVERSHRDNGHLFIVQESGTTHIEIDFEEHYIGPSSLIYIHPSQVHRLIAFKNASISTWIITSENLHPEFLKMLEDQVPAKVLALDPAALTILWEAASLCINIAARKEEKLYNFLLKESCNTLVALVVSQYLAESRSTDASSRYDSITKAFKSALETNFKTAKSPSAYAKLLNISTPYLNECVKATTGNPVSYHIQQRVILEAKRWLHHSDKTVKEISSELDYEDHSYFIRLFSKLTGMTPLAFRNKNLD
jgi:AraC family transcriptional regulator, transcriptional activator of pobA